MRTASIFILAATMHGVMAQVDLDSALVAHWPLDGDAQDISGNNLHGNLQGPLAVFDQFGDPSGALLFDGIDDHVELPALWAASPSAITFSCWFYASDTLPEGKLIYHGDNGEFQLLSVGDTLMAAVHLGNSLWYFVRGGFTGASWHFAAGRWSGNDGKLWLYMDGALVDSLALPLNALLDVGPSYPAALGSYPAGPAYHYNGSLDDVRIYGRALNNGELDSLYFGPIASVQEGRGTDVLVLYPNPAHSTLTLAGHNGAFAILSPDGRVMLQGSNQGGTFSVASLPAGLYLLRTERGTWRFRKD